MAVSDFIAHFESKHPWWIIDEFVKADSAKLVGALPSEVVVMNSLTVNLHLMVCSLLWASLMLAVVCCILPPYG